VPPVFLEVPADGPKADDLVGLGSRLSPDVIGSGWVPRLPFLEHREQDAPDHSIEDGFAWVILFGGGEQGVE
jgi:hypothetical protein